MKQAHSKPAAKHSRAWFFWPLIILLLTITFLAVIRLTLPYSIKWGAVSWLESQQLEADITDISIHLHKGSFSIYDLTIKDKYGKHYTLEHVNLSWQWKPLLQQQVIIDDISISALKLDASLSENGDLTLAGIYLPKSTDTPTQSSETSSSKPWLIQLSHFSLSDIAICGDNLTAENKTSESACLKLSELSWDGSIAYNMATEANSPVIDITGTLALVKPDICFNTPTTNDNTNSSYCTNFTDLNWKGNIKLVSDTADLFINGSLNINDLRVTDKIAEQNLLSLDSLALPDISINTLNNINIDSISISKLNALQPKASQTVPHPYNLAFELLRIDKLAVKNLNTIEDIQLSASLNINMLNIFNQTLELDLLTLGNLSLDRLNINTLDNISIDTVLLQQLSALQREPSVQAAHSHILSFDQLQLNNMALSNQNDLTIKAIGLQELSSYIIVSKHGNYEFDSWIAEKQDNTNITTNNGQSSFNYAIENITLNTQQPIIFQDYSQKEAFSAEINSINLELVNINTHQPDSPSHLVADIAINSHGSFNLDTTLTPFSEKPSVNGKGEISGLDLRLLSPFTKQHIGYSIKSGQLDSQLNINVTKGDIDSIVELNMHQFELKPLNTQEAEQFDSELGLPLNSALSLLRSKDNTIKLKIPVTGNIDNPEFNPRDALVKASSKAITTAVLYYYTPFGLVLAADALFDLATALNFDPVLFEAGSADLSSAQTTRLNQLVTLMNDRPGVHLTLCGMSNNSDRNVLYPQKKLANNETPDNNVTLNPVQISALQQLASSRSSNLKNTLVTKHAIKASRLIECSPEYNENAIAGVKINL